MTKRTMHARHLRRHQSPSWGAAESMDMNRDDLIDILHITSFVFCLSWLMIFIFLCTFVGFCGKCELGTDENPDSRYRMTGAVVHQVWWTCIACINYHKTTLKFQLFADLVFSGSSRSLWHVQFGINLAVIASWPHGLHSRPSVAEAYAVHLEEWPAAVLLCSKCL